MSRSSTFSSQSRQCCCLLYLMAFAYTLLASVCSLCTGCSASRLSLCDSLPVLFANFHSWVSSLVHHLLDLGVSVVMGTSLAMVSWMAMVSLRHSASKSSCVLISFGGCW